MAAKGVKQMAVKSIKVDGRVVAMAYPRKDGQVVYFDPVALEGQPKSVLELVESRPGNGRFADRFGGSAVQLKAVLDRIKKLKATEEQA